MGDHKNSVSDARTREHDPKLISNIQYLYNN